jgi:glycosyltransferase involved in cell wall biosynthesis
VRLDARQAVNVVLVTHYYPAHRGGVERIAAQLAERLVAAGNAAIEWHASDCDPAPAPVAGLRCVPAASWNFAERRLGFPYPLWSPGALRRLRRAVREADVVHVHDCLYLGSVMAFFAARLARTPVLVTQHVGFIPYRNPLLRLMLAAANRLLGRIVLGGASQVVFESDAVQSYFSRRVRLRSEPVLIANGVDTDSFAPCDAAAREGLRAALGAAPAQPLLLFIGRFVEKKGLPVLRELATRMPGSLWILGGLGPVDPRSWNLPNVKVVDAPRIDQLASLYQAADLLVLPSVGEGLPLVVQEAMACGTPALVGTETAAACPPQANAPLLAEPTGEADTARRWHKRLSQLLADPKSLAELRPRVAAFARDNWSWQQCVQRYAALLRDCAARSRL